MDLPPASQRVVDAARELGIAIQVAQFADSTKTAADAAAAVGCSVASIVKSLVFVVDSEPVIALIPGDLRLDPTKLASAAGASACRRASLDEARQATGFAPGGTPPFGYPFPIRVFADRRLSRHSQLWAAAGTPTTVFSISHADLVAATRAKQVDISDGGV